ncbi:hypothetical protein LZ30DRAFT_56414 [Colletotrichum cereale]|nr:hypothetical protein LZ30DRAFT_56414 [Colletotrichum cereale]
MGGGGSLSVQTSGCYWWCWCWCWCWCWVRVPVYLHPGCQQLRQACRLLAATGIPRVGLTTRGRAPFYPAFLPTQKVRDFSSFHTHTLSHTLSHTPTSYTYICTSHYTSDCLGRCSKAVVLSEQPHPFSRIVHRNQTVNKNKTNMSSQDYYNNQGRPASDAVPAAASHAGAPAEEAGRRRLPDCLPRRAVLLLRR